MYERIKYYVLSTTRWVENGEDPDQTVASDLGVHCLLRPVCLNT